MDCKIIYLAKGALLAIAAAVVLCIFALFFALQPAFGATVTDKAYSRSLAAVKAYATADGYSENLMATYSTNSAGYSVVKVKVDDLSLTTSQAQQVMDHLYGNTDIFYVDCVGEKRWTSSGSTISTLNYTFTYKDSEISGKAKKLASAASKAMARIKNCTSSVEKVHMLHDWIDDNISYVSNSTMKKLQAQSLHYRYKSSASLIEGYADCNGFMSAMDYLLRKAGFTTALVYNDSIDHCWNLVKVGSSWYHVDVTWDKAWGHDTDSTKVFYKKTCHYWMLVSDEVMNYDEHTGWTVWKNGVAVSTPKARKSNSKGVYCASSTKYDKYHYNYEWKAGCAKSLAKGKTFKVSGVTYTVTTKGKAAKVSKTGKSCTIPGVVWYRGHSYTVAGIAAKALKSCTKLTIKSASLTKKSVRKCLVGSKLKTITLKGSATAKKSAYKKAFAKSNSGRKVKIK